MTTLRGSGARFAFVGMAALCGCTFTGLGQYDVPRCDAAKAPTSLDDDPCHEIERSNDSCMRWQCVVETGRCELRPLDYDRDGDPAPACGGRDCNDRDPRRRAGGKTAPAETCDGIDNDCDGRADTDLLTVLSTSVVVSGRLDEPSFATSNGSELHGAAVIDAGGGARCVAVLRPSGTSPAPACFVAPATGVSPRQPWAQRLVPGAVGITFIGESATCAGALSFRNDRGAGADLPCTQAASLPAFAPYPGGSAIVVAYYGGRVLERVEPVSSCPALTPAPLDVEWLERPLATSADPPPRFYAQRLGLGSSLGVAPPSLVSRGDAVLLAAPADGAVGVWALRAPALDGSGPSVAPLAPPSSLGALADARATSIAIGTADGLEQLAIAAQLGCGKKIVVALAQLTEGPVLGAPSIVEIGEGRQPAIAFVGSRKEWWVTWIAARAGTNDVLRLTRLSADGTTADTRPVEVTKNATLGQPRAEPAESLSASVSLVSVTGFSDVTLGCP